MDWTIFADGSYEPGQLDGVLFVQILSVAGLVLLLMHLVKTKGRPHMSWHQKVQPAAAIVIAFIAGVATARVSVAIQGVCRHLAPGPDGASAAVCVPPDPTYVLALAVAILVGVLVFFGPRIAMRRRANRDRLDLDRVPASAR